MSADRSSGALMRTWLTSRAKVLAVASGFAVGGFLFFRYSQLASDDFWGLRWYEAALFLGGIGLAGAFPAVWRRTMLSMALAAFLGAFVQTGLDIRRDPTCCNLWPIGLVIWLVLGFPAPLIGGVIGHWLSRTRIPQFLYLTLLAGGLVMGASLPRIQQAEERRLEGETIPTLVKRIYGAEISYSASRADKTFACDGNQLGDVGKLRWQPAFDTRKGSWAVVEHYAISIDCPNSPSPHSFRVKAFSRRRTRTGPIFSIDETGEFAVSTGQANGSPRGR